MVDSGAVCGPCTSGVDGADTGAVLRAKHTCRGYQGRVVYAHHILITH